MSAKILLLCALCFVSANCHRFRVLFEWNSNNFTWLTDEDLRNAMSTGRYIPENNIISGIKYYNGWFYLSLPRMKQGVAATLARIPALAYYNDTEPLLEPYPSWNMNTEGDCDALQNVQNTEIDPTGKIWILDGGSTATMTKNVNHKCPPRLVIYDINTNATLINYVFPMNITNNRTFLYDIVIDELDGGYAYITDNSATDPGIIVYSLRLNRAWKVTDVTMHAEQDAIEFRVSGTAISSPINIAGIALGPRHSGDDKEIFVSQDRDVYFAPLSSTHLYKIKSSELRKEDNMNIRTQIVDLGRKSSQTDGMVADENGVLYYGLLSDNSIAKWDSKTPFTSEQKVIARDATYIQWPDSLAFDTSGNLIVVTNRLQKFIYGQMNLSEPNFRILESNLGVKSYLYGTPPEFPNTTSVQTTENTSTTYETHIATTETPNEEENFVEPSSAATIPYFSPFLLCVFLLKL